LYNSWVFEFKITGKLPDHGRAGLFTTPHGQIKTPVFMPVGTAGSVKSLTTPDLENIGAQIILSNNYHLYLHPGADTIKHFGGLHTFMNWTHPILTDSGGFQVQSLKPKITDDGVTFKSHIDGSTHVFTPESATQHQIDLGVDIIMAFDQSIPAKANFHYAKRATMLTHSWLIRCINTWKQDPYTQSRTALFGIVQGGTYPELLRQSAKFVASQDLPGIALGGANIGSDPKQTAETIAIVRDLLPQNVPLYTMGLGVRPSDLISAIQAGADMFDCVAPTRLARCGLLYNLDAPTERIDISKSSFKLDKSPIDPSCDCSTCQDYTRGYLHHLFKSRELTYHRLASIHNLRTMLRTVETYSRV
jgi:queuine tRNA-ribosyltransferase